jgi:hypothetical protein
MQNENPSEERSRVMRSFDAATNFVHAFLAGGRGYTSADIEAGIRRLKEACDVMEQKYGEGKNAEFTKTLISQGRVAVKEAQIALAERQK